MEPSYTTPIPSAAALEEEVRSARARHRERLDVLGRLSEEQVALRREINAGVAETSTVWDVVAAAFGPGDVTEHIRNLLSQIPVLSGLFAQQPDAVMLEDKVELAQRRVLQIAHHLDRLSVDRAALQRELEELGGRIVSYGSDARVAAEAILSLEAAHEAALEAQDASASVLEGRILQRMAELRAFERAVSRLSSILHLHHEFLRLNENVERSLSQLHAAGTEMLDALDAELAHLATAERAKQLARVVTSDLGSLRDSVARINRLATEGAVLLTENLDRLADEVDLLAPSDPEAVAAERELSTFLRDRTVEEAVARARQQVALRERLSKRGSADEP